MAIRYVWCLSRFVKHCGSFRISRNDGRPPLCQAGRQPIHSGLLEVFTKFLLPRNCLARVLRCHSEICSPLSRVDRTLARRRLPCMSHLSDTLTASAEFLQAVEPQPASCGTWDYAAAADAARLWAIAVDRDVTMGTAISAKMYVRVSSISKARPGSIINRISSAHHDKLLDMGYDQKKRASRNAGIRCLLTEEIHKAVLRILCEFRPNLKDKRYASRIRVSQRGILIHLVR